MVNIDIPKHDIPQNDITSPSSFGVGTPHLTINRDVTVELDSKNAFEGPEKLLEVWFTLSPTSLPASARPNGLKSVSVEVWKEMLDLVNCKVLSIIQSEHVDAYLLSESSMFVFPHKLVLKTCGTTTLLYGLPRILEIAALSAGFPHTPAKLIQTIPAAATPYRVFYSRKNFLFPDQQRGPHRSWRDEVRFLDKMFLGGSAYMIGKMNGDHWYLYITGPETRLTPPATPENEKFVLPETKTEYIDLPDGVGAAVSAGGAEEAHDETLEILMTDLDEEGAKQFYLDHANAVAEGRLSNTAHKARKDAIRSLGTIAEQETPDSSINGRMHHNHQVRASSDDFDVFEQASSDHSGFSSEVDLTFAEELTTEGHSLGTIVSEASGLSDVYPASKFPDARIDAYLFTPCGFSANGVIPAPDGADAPNATHYFTVHVTPEPHCSYASFETNVPARQTGRQTAEIVEQVVDIFKPGRFSVTLFEAKPSHAEGGLQNGDSDSAQAANATGTEAVKKSARMETIKGYRRMDRIVHDLDGYDLVFRYYERYDWKGGAPRLGELSY